MYEEWWENDDVMNIETKKTRDERKIAFTQHNA